MNNLVFAAILPHGDVIPDIAGPNASKTRALHLAMMEAGRRMAEARPDTIVIATPHGIRIEGAVCVSLTGRAAGVLPGYTDVISVDMPVDQNLAWHIAEDAERAGVPVARCTYAMGMSPEARLPLDWGAVTPLWYCGAQWAKKPNVIVVVPARSVDESHLVEFGRSVARLAAKSQKRVAFIASCDWAHAHDANGPYGYHPDARAYDQMAQDVITGNDLLAFLNVDEGFIENAKPDGNWQCLMLAGALEGSSLMPELLCYDCPTYFGMLVATYQ